MSDALTISLSTEQLESCSAEEQATFGLFSLTANDHLLTAGMDTAGRRELRHGPHVAGYPLAEWLVWNWWRLRWEFGRPADDDGMCRWDLAHRMSTVGDGYVWPDITIFSDGVQSFLDSRQSQRPETLLFQYFGACRRETVSMESLEAAIDGFVADILARLEGQGLGDTNLHRLWNDLKTEREDEGLGRFRQLEAQLGCDPDEADEDAIRRCLAGADELGEEAWGEVAAEAALSGYGPDGMMTAEEFATIAARSGFDARLDDAVTLTQTKRAKDIPQPGNVAAWRLGECVAQGLRSQEKLDGQPISDTGLADFAGTTAHAISAKSSRSRGMSFALDREDGCTRISLRSKWQTGRRFELARLIGDRMVGDWINWPACRLFPATRAYSYRQKTQRAFATELLSPFAAVEEMLAGDYSEESQAGAAEHFKVSPWTIQTQLVNHRRIALEDAPDIAARDFGLYGR